MKISRDKFRDMFPYISKELEDKKHIKKESSDEFEEIEITRRQQSDPLFNYDPDVIAYIRRCNTIEQALEIIEYLKKRGKITLKYAESLEKQLDTKGLPSFGQRKKRGYYVTKYYSRESKRG